VLVVAAAVDSLMRVEVASPCLGPVLSFAVVAAAAVATEAACDAGFHYLVVRAPLQERIHS
jgi:hypothetical protein